MGEIKCWSFHSKGITAQGQHFFIIFKYISLLTFCVGMWVELPVVEGVVWVVPAFEGCNSTGERTKLTFFRILVQSFLLFIFRTAKGETGNDNCT